jgi:hypothetical protein
MKGGILFEDYKRGFGQDDPDLLVWRASSVLMNPALRAERLERQRRLDPERFAREYEAEFSDDVDTFLPGDWIESATMRGRFALPAQPDTTYTMAVDTSGGGPEHFTCAVVHVEGRGTDRRVVQDICKGWGRIGNQAPDLRAGDDFSRHVFVEFLQHHGLLPWLNRRRIETSG